MFHRRLLNSASAGRLPVVLVHGLGLSGRYMLPTAEHLAPHFPVYLPDLPGFGDSAKPGRALDVPELADTLAAWMRTVGLAPAALLGNSFGCQIIADLAARHPALVERAVLQGSTTPPDERSRLWQFVRWRQNQPFNPEALGPITWDDYRKCGYLRLLQTFRHQISDPIEQKLSSIAAPTLVVRGQRDPICHPAFAEDVARRLPRGRLIEIPEVAHTLVYTAPEQVAQVTRQFLEEPGQRLLEANPNLQLHHMHDANQDRLMTHYMTYFRIKRRRLGATYARFLAERLAPGGLVLLLDCRHSWPTTRVGPRHVFQHGGSGGMTPKEYIEGGPRVAAWFAARGLDRCGWDSPAPDGTSPEAEWGFEEALATDLEQLASARGYRLVRISFDEPEDPSPLVAELYRFWYRERGLDPNRLLVDSFILMDPWWTLRLGAVPFWMKFNTETSANALERYLDQAAPYDEIHLMLFAHGVDSIGLTPIERWRALLRRARRQGRFVGVDEEAYPADFATFARYHPALRQIPGRHPLPPPLTGDLFERFLHQSDIAARTGVTVRTATPD